MTKATMTEQEMHQRLDRLEATFDELSEMLAVLMASAEQLEQKVNERTGAK